ncbi:Fic family protein [Pseudomonas aeruginosa]|nr:Fic family protein [Pseudomonas aeruginosa]
MTQRKSGKPLTAEERQALEAEHTFRRIVELRLDPVRGKFDADHLKEINRRIFQDLPGLGFDDVTPGEYRPAVAAGNDWMKTRSLETVEAPSNVAYSRMDKAAQARLDKALESANPASLGKLRTTEFTQALGKLYAELDYIHPFSDGNSRTLREFTRQLAEASGYTLDWERFGKSAGGRDVLYIARDRSVNELALPHIQHAGTKRDVVLTMDQFEANRDLPDLLRDAIRPTRAIAFEQLPEVDALRAHADLGDAFKTMRTAAQYFEAKMPSDAAAQRNALLAVRKHVQTKLDQGETRDFRQSAAEKQKAHGTQAKQAQRQDNRTQGPEHER